MTRGKKNFFLDKKEEFFYKKAKKVKLRARSYFKLEAIDKKFNLIKEKQKILDLGCAPGAWLQYCDNKIEKGEIIGVDLLDVSKKEEFSSKVKIIKGDFKIALKKINEEFDLILSDMAPEFSGNSKLDRGRTHMINLSTINFSKKLLKKKGNLIIKTFEGEDLDLVKKEMKKIFYEIKCFKPQSSKKKSSEFYLIGIKKKL